MLTRPQFLPTGVQEISSSFPSYSGSVYTIPDTFDTTYPFTQIRLDGVTNNSEKRFHWFGLDGRPILHVNPGDLWRNCGGLGKEILMPYPINQRTHQFNSVCSRQLWFMGYGIKISFPRPPQWRHRSPGTICDFKMTKYQITKVARRETYSWH